MNWYIDNANELKKFGYNMIANLNVYDMIANLNVNVIVNVI